MNNKVSFLIPSRNEIYLEATIKNILKNCQGDIEIIAVLDGYKPNPPIKINDDRVLFLYYENPIGQRAAINEAAKIATGNFVCKLDAHCAIDEGFDIKLTANCEHDWTVIPRMRNLDPETFMPRYFDDNETAWRRGKIIDYMYIGLVDGELRTQYYPHRISREMRKEREHLLIDETMSCQGCCFFMHKDRFWELGGCDENHGSWGNQGIEVALKAWLSGGKLMVNKNTWFAHLWRKESPYHLSGRQVNYARNYSKDLWMNNKWPKQIITFQKLIERFNPPRKEELLGINSKQENDLTILYYTANKISEKIQNINIRHLKKFGYPIISVSQKPMDFGENICVGDIGQNIQNIYKQVLIGAKKAKTKYVALCEDDCFYVEDHFKFRPQKPFGYNLNRWLLHLDCAKFSYRDRPILSQCIADREILIKNLEERFKLPEIPNEYCGEMGVFDKKLGMTEYEYETFKTEEPNMVVCHRRNTMGRKFLGENVCEEIEHWGKVEYWMKKFGINSQGYSLVQRGGGLREIKFDSIAKTRSQFSHIASTVIKTEDLYTHRMEFADPRKLKSMEWFTKVFRPFIESIHKGKEYTNEELETLPYYEYLISKLNPVDRDPLTKKGKRHILNLMKDAIQLYHDIKKNGLRNPLDAWKEPNGKLTINRGGRRLEILHLLGIETTPIRIFRNAEMFRRFIPEKNIVEDNSVHHLAMQQFQKLQEFATDKYWVHGYTRLYDKHIGYLRNQEIKILEIGVFRGASLLLWKEAFPKAQIYGVDKNTKIWQKFLHDQDRIKVLIGRQEDEKFLKEEVIPCGEFDIIIDDGGHSSLEQWKSFETLWRNLNHKGWYVIEDIYGNYKKGLSENSMVTKLKSMVDNLHINPTIRSITFYYNICFIEKI